MALRIRRGTDAQRTGKTFEMGEIVYTTDAQQVWIGNGITAGGVPVVGSNVAGYGIVYNNVTKKLDVSGLTSDDVTQGINNKYFSTELAVDAVGAALVAGNSTNVGITFTYAQTQDDAGRINATVALDGVGITDVVNDTTPQLGGDLDLNSFAITGTGDIDFTGSFTLEGNLTQIGNLTTSGSLLSSNADVPDTSRAVGPLYVGLDSKPTTLWVKSNKNFAVLSGITDGTNNSGILSRVSRGTLTSKTTLQAGDAVTFIDSQGWDGTDWTPVGAMLIGVDPSGSVSTGAITGTAGFIVQDGLGGVKVMSFNSKGVLNAPVIQATSYPTVSLPSSPQAGWIAFDSTTNQFKGWNGTSWVVLG